MWFFLSPLTFTDVFIPPLLSLQGECGAVSATVVCVGDGKQAVGSTIKDGLMTEDICDVKMLVSGP